MNVNYFLAKQLQKLIFSVLRAIIYQKDGVIYMSIVGKKIMERRKELGWTQEELAKKMGYKSKSTINKIELGVNDIPQSKVIKFATVLSTTPAYIMGWQEVQKKGDVISTAALRMKKDSEFLSLVEKLVELDSDKIRGVEQMLSAFLK